MHVGNEVGLYAGLTELGQIHLRRIKEVQALGGTHHQLFGSFCREGHGRHFYVLGQHRLLAVLQHALLTSQECKRQDNFLVLALLEINTQRIGNCPGIRGEILGAVTCVGLLKGPNQTPSVRIWWDRPSPNRRRF